MSVLDLPIVAPDRQTSGFAPLKVLHHFGKLVEDKEDTEQVFHIIEAVKGKKSHKQARDFILSDEGQRFLREETNIPAMLDDHARWADLPENSVGKRYMAFMKREGLTAAGLVEESHKFSPPQDRPQDQTQWYFNRLRDTHDLFHVLTGYGRDALGEASLLGFSYSQNYNRGVQFIAFAAARQIKKTTGTSAPLYGAVLEGQRLGATAAKLAHMDVEAVMREDIDEARARMNIDKPVLYRECLKQLEEEGFAEESLALQDAQAA
ncbi:MAG: Coq4 family protein [Pseudomonadota bacterium]